MRGRALMRARPNIAVRLSIVLGAGVLAGSLPIAAQQTTPTPAARQPTRAAAASAPPAAAPDPIDYNWDVRPILSENCFQCHGPDEKARRAGLRLDQPDGAPRVLNQQSGRRAIVPGSPDQSELITRITHPTAALRMPPLQTNKTLSPDAIDTLRRWIAEGAQYKPHWSFITPARPVPPSLAARGRQLTEIDRFVLRRLQKDALQLSPEAD